MKQETVVMEYLGNLSANHYLGRRRDGGYYIKPEVKAWKEEFGWKIKGFHLEDWKLPLSVICSGIFKDERSAPDLSNLSKVILDSIEETCGVNDKNYRWYDGTRTISRGETNPYLLITIAEKEE